MGKAKYRVFTSETVEKKIKKFAPHLLIAIGEIKEGTRGKPICWKSFKAWFLAWEEMGTVQGLLSCVERHVNSPIIGIQW